MKSLPYRALLLSTLLCGPAMANNDIQACLNELFLTGDGSLTLAQMREMCQPSETVTTIDDVVEVERTDTKNTPIAMGNISRRIIGERRAENNPYVLTPHKMNYILPVMTTNGINKEAYSSFDGYEENLADVETKFQLSLKVPLYDKSLFIEGDGLYLGFTLEAWWQIYSENLSKPFRETNYQPEVFYIAPFDWHPFGGNTGFVLGIEHQSNGRGTLLSRSWNRVYGHLLFEKDAFALSLKPWVRLSEEEKEFPFDPDGDDNPDIEDYMGNFELGMVYQWQDLEFTFGGRRNFSTKNGAAELGVTFPLWGKLRGYAVAFNGYGESLIDYNYKQTRFGIGVTLNNTL